MRQLKNKEPCLNKQWNIQNHDAKSTPRNTFTQNNPSGFSSVHFILQVMVLFDKSLDLILKSPLTQEQKNLVTRIQQNIVCVFNTCVCVCSQQMTQRRQEPIGV